MKCIFFFPISYCLLLVGQVPGDLDLGPLLCKIRVFWLDEISFFWPLLRFCPLQTGFSSIYGSAERWFHRPPEAPIHGDLTGKSYFKTPDGVDFDMFAMFL